MKKRRMKQKSKWMAAMLTAACAMTAVMGCGGNGSDNGNGANAGMDTKDVSGTTKQEAGTILETLSYDAELMPEGYKSVVYLSGTWHDMGVQYAMQVPDVVKRETATGISSAIAEYGEEDAKKMSKDYIEYYKEHAPQLLELYQGMAEGIDMNFDDFIIGCVNYAAEAMTADDVERDNTEGCSNIAAWGESTKDGMLIVGADWDSIGADCYYAPIVVAFPENGNAFINASGFAGNLAMNAKGLVCAGSSGQSAGEGDNAMGLPVMTSQFLGVANYDTAEDAQKNYLENYIAIYAENQNYHDLNGGHVLTEASKAHHATRKNGDFGETDYLIATNDFMTEEMQSSLLPAGSGYDDCRPRYWTEEKILLDAKGEATVQTIAAALGEQRYYENGKWIEDNWSLETGLNSPEAISPYYQNVLKSIAVPETGAFYVMNGCSNTEVSLLPEASGSYVQLILSDDMWMINSDARSTANMLIFDAGNYIAHAMGDMTKQTDDLNMAKEALIAGDNYTAQAGCAEDENTARMLLGKATSQYMKAQVYAQSAQDDLTAILNY